MKNLPKTLLKITENKNILAEINEHVSNLEGNLYLYDISDILIENVGRFCEKHLSDFLITWDSVIKAIQTKNEGIYCFGLRKFGVDHNAYVFLRLRDYDNAYMSEYYRKIFAVEFHKYKDDYNQEMVKIMLKNVTGLSFDKDDIDYDINKL